MTRSAILQRIGLVVASVVWAGCVMSGSFVMLTYANTPGDEGQPPVHWPDSTTIHRDFDTFTMLLFAHPHCPCTDATFEQLLRVLTRAKLPVNTHTVFTIPEGTEPGWVEGPLLERARATTPLTVHFDRDAVETRRFAVATSGHVLLYAPSGRLLFSGGITPSRGHEGDNHGTKALVEHLNGMQPITKHPPVYGCPLLDEADSDATLECCSEGAACPL